MTDLRGGMEDVSFCWKDICVEAWQGRTGSSTRTILNNVSGYVNKGELVAIMGPSAAGKTTLLNALMLQNISGLKVSGERYANGISMSPMHMTSVAGYMHQTDLFVGTLTVREHLTFLADLRFGGMTPQEKTDKVNTVLTKLGLSKCADTLIGIRGHVKGISGGEMRRLSFASEVLSDPPMLLCDEPTSGLDSWMAENVMNLMREMTNHGQSILCVIHQPSSKVYHKFDRVLLMVNGRSAFMGTSLEAEQFFTEIGYPCPELFNPADHFINKMSMMSREEDEYEQRLDYICEQFQSSKYAKILNSEIDSHIHNHFHNEGINASSLNNPYRSTWIQQFIAVFWRSWSAVVKDPKVATIRIIEAIVMSFLVGTIYFNLEHNQAGIISIDGAMFFVVTNQFFSNYTVMLNIFMSEIPVFLREHNSGLYRTDVYFLGKQLADVPHYVLTPVLFMSIFYYMVGLNSAFERFAVAILIIVVLTQAAVGMGVMMSCLSPNLAVALAIGPTIFVPLLNVGGLYMNEATIPDWLIWMRYISLWFYGNEALNINQWTDVEGIECEFALEDPRSHTCLHSGQEVLDFFAFREDKLWMDICALMALAIVFRFIGYCALYCKVRKTVNH